jgi:prepilin-type N-terminal cleavage/methylation domain-containing protein/prepilin-type processing-associated H-X9-DG protein
MPARRRAFTLVELLVVVGVVAALVALLLPTLGAAWGQARRVHCASNLRQLAAAFHAYANNNRQRFPAAAVGLGFHRPEDWVHWESGRDLRDSAIAPYMAALGEALLCPSDDPQVRPSTFVLPGQQYRFSYSFNYRYWDVPVGRVRQPTLKVLLIDEDEATLNNGQYSSLPRPLSSPHGVVDDTLANRHDRRRHAGWRAWRLTDLLDTATRPDRSDRGNAAFADGHVDFVTREFTWDHRHHEPFWPDFSSEELPR